MRHLFTYSLLRLKTRHNLLVIALQITTYNTLYRFVVYFTHTLSASLGRFLGTWVSPRCEQSTVSPTQEQAHGHLVNSPAVPCPCRMMGCPPMRLELPMSLPPPSPSTTHGPNNNNTGNFIVSKSPSLAVTLHIVRGVRMLIQRCYLLTARHSPVDWRTRWGPTRACSDRQTARLWR